MVYPEAARVGDSPNKSVREQRVTQFIVHHTAATGNPEGVWDMFMTANDRDVCPTWLVTQSGEAWECMHPDIYRPWTTGAIDHSVVTVETMDRSTAWDFTPESVERIAKLVAWSSQRYGFPVNRQTVRGHREIPGQSTACPGQMPLDFIVDRANQILAGDEFVDGTPAQIREALSPLFEPVARDVKNLLSL